MARKPRILTKLRIDEVSSVDRGAGEGVRIVLMKRYDDGSPRNRFEEAFRSVDFSKIKAPPPEPQDDDTELSPQLEQHINALITAVPSLDRQQAAYWLLQTASGRTLARHLSSTFKSQKETPMSRFDALRQFTKECSIHKLAALVIDGNSTQITSDELYELAFEEATKSAKPGERPATTFARWYEEPAQLELRKAMEVAKNALFAKAYPNVLDLKPTQVGGSAAMNVNDASEAYNQLTAMAEGLRAKSPTLTVAQAFSRVFQDPANVELANKAHRRPAPTTSYPMP